MATFKLQASFEKRPPSPFGKALKIAKMIKDRNDDISDLRTAMAVFDERGKENLAWRLLEEVMELRASLPALFAVAYLARRIYIAHYGAALFKLTREGGVSLRSLPDFGLARAYVLESGRKGIRYIIGRKVFEAAIAILQKDGKYEAAEILRKPLLMAEKNSLLRQERRRQDAATADVQAVAEAVGTAVVAALPEQLEETSPPAAVVEPKPRRGRAKA